MPDLSAAPLEQPHLAAELLQLLLALLGVLPELLNEAVSKTDDQIARQTTEGDRNSSHRDRSIPSGVHKLLDPKLLNGCLQVCCCVR